MSVLAREPLAPIYPGVHSVLANTGMPLRRVDLAPEGVRVELPDGNVFVIRRETLMHLARLRAYRGIVLLTTYLHRYYVGKWGTTWH